VAKQPQRGQRGDAPACLAQTNKHKQLTANNHEQRQQQHNNTTTTNTNTPTGPRRAVHT